MIKKFLIGFLLISAQVSCTKENNAFDKTLNGKWQLYTTVIVKADDMQEQRACQYATKVSDLYYEPINYRCDVDDVYDFTKPNTLTINFGNKRCSFDEPANVTKNYERKGDSIITNDFRYNIVFLSKDTLILDYCTDLTIYPPTTTVLNRAKLGIKFIRMKK